MNPLENGEPSLTKGNGNWKVKSCIVKMVIDMSLIFMLFISFLLL